MEIQWFPGHMAKTRKMMEENIALVDAVVEVVDARIPYSSKNPYLDELWRRRPRILALNKIDLADPVKTELWKRWYEAQGYGVVLLDALHGTGIAQIGPMAKRLCQEKIQKEAAKGRQERALRLMITGIPNVGKSTVINRIIGRKEAAKTGNKPGVTRTKQWIRLRGGIELLDTPGMLWPKFEDPKIGERIACIGSIKAENLDAYTVAVLLLGLLREEYGELLPERYKLTAEEMQADNEQLLLLIGAHRGHRVSGGHIDWERTARVILDEFRNGKMGRITLEVPEDERSAEKNTGGEDQTVSRDEPV